MIDWFSDIKYFYEKKLWTKKQVFDVVGKRITPEQYKEITIKYCVISISKSPLTSFRVK